MNLGEAAPSIRDEYLLKGVICLVRKLGDGAVITDQELLDADNFILESYHQDMTIGGRGAVLKVRRKDA